MMTARYHSNIAICCNNFSTSTNFDLSSLNIKNAITGTMIALIVPNIHVRTKNAKLNSSSRLNPPTDILKFNIYPPSSY